MAKKASSSEGSIDPKELLIVSHFIKYNMYLTAKAMVFAAIYGRCNHSIESCVEETERAMGLLDLESARKIDDSGGV